MRISQLPVAIQERVLQIRPNINLEAQLSDAFNWQLESPEGHRFWEGINMGIYTAFYDLYPDTLNEKPLKKSKASNDECITELSPYGLIVHSFISPEKTSKMVLTKAQAKLLLDKLQNFVNDRV